LSLVGESGCGKSTTGRSVMRLIEPTSGDVALDGYDVLRLDQTGLRDMRKTIQMIFQDPFSSLNPRMTVGAAISEPFVKHKLGNANRPRKRPPTCSARSAFRPTWQAVIRTNFPAASASASPLPAPCRSIRR
jgi:ABC-type glutathione transport system ATPase component